MSQLEWLDRTGRRLSLVGEAGLYRNPRLSPDNTKIVVERLSGSGGVATADLWILDARRGVPQKLTSAAGGELSPVWSHDGRSVTYSISKPAILRQRIVAPEAEAEAIFDAQAIPQDYSLHDDALLFDQNVLNGRRPTAFLLTLADRSSTEFLKGAENFQSRVSPDGTLLAFASTESGRPEIFVADFPNPSGKKRVSITGGIQPVWWRDGKELFFLSPEGGLMAASIDRKGELIAGDPVQLFLTRTEGRGSNVPLVLHQYDVAQDGRFLVNSSLGESSLSPLTLVVNWTQLLQER
jgi:Tol biopolymer transport system component